MKTALPVKDKQTVTPDGQSTQSVIQGVIIRRLAPQEDDRGEVCEVFNPAWGVHPMPLVYVYQATIAPKKVKGWVVHRKQDDRLFISMGKLRIVLYDDRSESPTYRMLNVHTISERNRALIVIPQGVFHAVQNVGEKEAVFINMPTRPYNHADPDKFRLPLKNDLIPFDFDA
jgi:dTDP-4-dehydrorhamnose 3,5-epimerase